jgi:hypothetical protein
MPQRRNKGHASMSKPVVWTLVGLAVVAALAIAWFTVGDRLLPGVARMGEGNPEYERSFNEAFEKSMREECMSTARQAAQRQGQSGPEIDAVIQRRCECALDVVRPMPISDKAELSSNSEKLAKVLAEIAKRCAGK